MTRVFRAIGDRMLGSLLPKAAAKADYCWYGYDGTIPEKCCYYTGPNRTYCWYI